MKKYFTVLFVAIFSLVIVSCDDRNDVITTDNDTYAVMKDVTGSLTSSNGFALTQGIDIPTTDVVLVYRRVVDAWQPIPKAVYLPNVATLPTGREFDYNFVFDSQNVQIRVDDENFNLVTEITPTETNQYLANQTFRIVLIPASQGKNANVDYNDYNAVIKYYNIKDQK
jgi:hypothetical protein